MLIERNLSFVTIVSLFQGHILKSSIAPTLATLPFGVLRQLCDVTPLSTDDGLFLRKMSLEIGVVHLLLACLSALSHHSPRKPSTSNHHDVRRRCVTSSHTLRTVFI